MRAGTCIDTNLECIIDTSIKILSTIIIHFSPKVYCDSVHPKINDNADQNITSDLHLL